MVYWRATLFSIIFDSALKLEIGLKFLNCEKSASGFLNRGDNTADFKHVGMQPSRRERLMMLAIVGSNRSIHCLIIEDGNGSKTQDFENSVAVSSLMSSSFISVKVENLVEDIVSTSSVTQSAEYIRAFFLTRRSLCSVSILVVKKVANSSASIRSFLEDG